MSNGMKVFILVVVLIVCLKHPEIVTKLINAIANLLH